MEVLTRTILKMVQKLRLKLLMRRNTLFRCTKSGSETKNIIARKALTAELLKAVINKFNNNILGKFDLFSVIFVFKLIYSLCLEAIEKDDLLEVKCDKISSFPPVKIKFGKSTLKLEADYYIQKTSFKCWSLLEGLFGPNGEWILGNPFLRKYYYTYNMTPKAASVTFYEAKKYNKLS